MGLDAFKWTALLVFIGSALFNLSRGDGIAGSIVAALLIAVIAGGLVSLGVDKLRNE